MTRIAKAGERDELTVDAPLCDSGGGGKETYSSQARHNWPQIFYCSGYLSHLDSNLSIA